MAISASFTFSGVATPLVKKSVAAATSFTATIDDLSGIQQVEWSIVGTDGETEASDYTLTPSGSKGSVVTITSGAAFTGAMLRARVSSGGFSDTKQAIFYVESTGGLEPLIFNELLESDSNAGYVRKLNATTATIEGAAGFNAQASTVDITTTGTAGTTNVGTRSTEVVTVGNSAGALSLAGSTASTNANTSITLRAPIVNVNVTGAGGTTNIATRAGEDTNLGNATGSLAVTADAVTVTTPIATFSGDIRANGAARYTTGDFNSGAEDGDAHFYGSADVYVETTAGDIFVAAGGAGKTITIDADNVEITGLLTNNGSPIGVGSSITDGTATLTLNTGSLSESGLVNWTLTPSGTWSVTAGGAMTLGAASLSLFPGTNSAVTSWAAEDANTSDDTPTQIGSTWTIADDSAYVVDAQVVAATDGAEIVRVHNVRRVVKATGSTITDGTQTDTSGPESLGGTLATAVSITRTGATGRVDITGVAGTDIRWRADVTITRLTMPPAPPFVMADIEWEGWIDGPGYSAGTFTGKASAGGSGSRNFDALGTPSTSTENGLATVLLDGTDDYIRYIGGSESADLIAPAGYTYFSVCRIDASSTNSADPFSNPSLGGTGDANAATGVDSAGNIEAYQYQGGNKIAATTWTTTVLVCVFTRYDGTNISVRKGKGAWTNTASSATAATASTWRWGTDYTTTARLTGEFCEHGVTKQVLSDAECDDIADAMAARWGVSV